MLSKFRSILVKFYSAYLPINIGCETNFKLA